ncbi:L-threonylcarbamoyladenylate synthase [Oleiharenicola lentus]|uniref:L-threonylcarbamoyladenylate synthase n=1 Tax=Oleiharenicola lentus TaxID=2508720 RepID=UPI003F673195
MKAKTYKPTLRNLRYLAAELRKGELVAIPTETVYGLAANALDSSACRKIFKAKQRPRNDPLIVHVLGLEQAEQLADFNPAARKVAKKFWPGPLTLVLPRKACIPRIVTSGGDTVAIRAPLHEVARKLLKIARVPLAAPSANSFSYISPTEAAHVTDGLGARIRHVIDGGPCVLGVESTILDLTDPNNPRVLRPGSIGVSALQKVLGNEVRETSGAKSQRARQVAPGMLAKHYSPRTPLRLTNAINTRVKEDTGIIVLRRPRSLAAPNIFWLSERGSLEEIARNLYRVLRHADKSGFKEIVVEKLLAEGELAGAINDRLKRAAAKR